ncbi:MAG: DHH family phosphoesterase, partial [Prevotellaceae bacterium]|nr:DHH family phosphoesterase [Prevotellaceae bacterium]
MNYRWNLPESNTEEEEKAGELAKALGMSPVLCRLLLRRGITDTQEARRFFHPQLSELHDPFLFKDMDTAVARLNEAIGRKERILVYGDYDVDGVTAVALVFKFIRRFYSNVDYYIPDRYEEGYGVSTQGIDYAEETNVRLVIVLDCGIKAVETIQYAKDKGIDFIICDHHVPDAVLPPAVAILNAKRPDDTYPYKELSGCGVGFKLMQGFAQTGGIEFSQLYPLLDLCAVSIASDIVPILGENRILAYHGLRQLNSRPSVGIQAIMDICALGEREVTLNDIIFKIGPRLNASGRVQNGKEAVKLLVERDAKVALREASLINHYNDQRKDLDKSMTEEANNIVKSLDSTEEQKAIVIYNAEWHKGVIGIV